MAQAAKEKEKGNAAFKAGDYPAAIGHYSAAIHADRTDATFPLNRAAAYLKLGKNEDAERDCSTVLTLSKGNVKGLFRRAQARVGMGKLSEAEKDLKEAAKLEPANQSVKQELSKIAELIQQAAIASAKKSQAVPADVSPAPKRRRIPITIVEPDGRRSTAPPTAATPLASTSTPKPVLKSALRTSPAAEATDQMKAVSSRPLTAPSSAAVPAPDPVSAPAPAPPKPAAQPQPVPKPSSFKEAKSARDSSRPSRVGGGVFRASGDNTIFAPREGKAAARQDVPATKVDNTSAPKPKSEPAASPAKQDAHPPPAPTPTPTPSTPPTTSPPAPAQKLAPPATRTKSPMTLFDFMRAWESTPDPAARFTLLSKIPPSALASLFQTSLEPALFAEIVDTLGAEADADAARAYMCAFPTVARFGTVVRFLSRAEKARVRAVWAKLGVGAGVGTETETEGAEAGVPPQLEEVWGAVYL
ncbi:hypothetical protein C8R46DRAFT_500390 [Mycena filopes]|nr:hypothetical protein C8R46DRAFT_500390 [Mycena filopes]